MEEACIVKESKVEVTKLDQVKNIIMKTQGTQYSPVTKNKQTKGSPIIVPTVIRPKCHDTLSADRASNASVSNISSVISKLSKA
jgi:hypothetical protein